MTEAASPGRAPRSSPLALRLLSDERLARRATRGERGAFEEIYRRYHQGLYRFCLAMVGNPADAQDALQSTMVKVLRALPGEEREIQLKPWLYRIARNEAIETLRRRRPVEELEQERADPVGLAETAEARERLRRLLADLEQLPERQRAALLLRELAGLDFAEIAASFETSPAVARQTLYEARLSLRQMQEGREMRCTDVMRELSDADGRVTRRRQIRTHLRDCGDCRAFQEEIAGRRGELAAIAPLPLAASAGLLHGVLGDKAGAAVGKTIAASALVKSVATVAVIGTIGVTAADRGGLIHLSTPNGGSGGGAQQTSQPSADPTATPAGGAGGGAAQGEAVEAAGAGAGPGIGAAEPGGRVGERSGSADRAPADRSQPSGSPNAESASERGLRPPGGGHGRSSAERRGRPEALPAGAQRGQQNAAAHRPSHAGNGTPVKGKGKSASGPQMTPPEKAKAPPQPPPHPQAKGNSAGAHGTPKGIDTP